MMIDGDHFAPGTNQAIFYLVLLQANVMNYLVYSGMQ